MRATREGRWKQPVEAALRGLSMFHRVRFMPVAKIVKQALSNDAQHTEEESSQSEFPQGAEDDSQSQDAPGVFSNLLEGRKPVATGVCSWWKPEWATKGLQLQSYGVVCAACGTGVMCSGVMVERHLRSQKHMDAEPRAAPRTKLPPPLAGSRKRPWFNGLRGAAPSQLEPRRGRRHSPSPFNNGVRWECHVKGSTPPCLYPKNAATRRHQNQGPSSGHSHNKHGAEGMRRGGWRTGVEGRRQGGWETTREGRRQGGWETRREGRRQREREAKPNNDPRQRSGASSRQQRRFRA